ncbi:MAG: peptide ABC transporter substrate-binding protein [Steroidobacteraceae bacterium]
MRALLSPWFAIGLALALAACGGQSLPGGGGNSLLRRGLSGEPASLDPAAASDNFSTQVMQDLYEGLTSESASGAPVPGAASAWTVDATGREYRFQLREDARWSNGSPVRARDFVSAWQRVIDPKNGSPVADNLRLIEGAAAIIAGKADPGSLAVYAPDDRTLIVKLTQPAPYFPEVLTHSSTFPIYSAISAGSHSPETWVSNGPYVLKRWRPGTTIELAKNPQYWDRAHVQIAAIQYQIASDETAQLSRYRAGELDLTNSVPPNAFAALKGANSSELVIAPFLATAYYGINLKFGPTADNIKLRRALAMSIDRHRLVAALGAGQTPAYGFLPPGIWNYSQQFLPWKDLPDQERIDEAKRLFSEAGIPGARPLRLRLLFNSNVVIKQTAILIAAMWKEVLGIDTALIDEENRVFLISRHDRMRWDVARLGWVADFNDASNFLDIFREHSTNNDAGYSNAAFEALLDAAADTADPAKRRSLLEQAERLMIGDYPIIPLYHFVSKRLVKPYVSGVDPSPLDGVPSKALSITPH